MAIQEIRTSETFADLDGFDTAAGGIQVLTRFEDHQPFAYTHDRRSYRRVADHSEWALEMDGWIVSSRSGRPLAFRVGRFFLDPETLSLLYFARADDTVSDANFGSPLWE